MAFFQSPPELGNQYQADRVLRGYLRRTFDRETLAATDPELDELGDLAGDDLYRLQLADRLNEPVLTQWDPWGHRIDQIEVTALWKRAQVIAAERGLIATGYERKYGSLSRPLQLALMYLFDQSTDFYTCPLAMTDGAAKTLTVHRNAENREVVDHALSHLTSRDALRAWTSGQWMTERTGGSDVGLSETVARQVDGGWRLYGTKWFTSAVTADIALALARPEGNGPGGKGLALFLVELRDDLGRLRNIQVNRLKDKLGTRKVPTAELTLDGAPATPLVGLDNGVKHITPMLAVTRTWNAVCSAASMRRSVALARDYAKRRVAFGTPLAQKPLHQETLADMQAEAEAGFHLAFRCAELIGLLEAGKGTERDELALRLITPLAKLTSGKQSVAVASEALETFGGAGYVEDTGLPRLLRDAQVYPIWEGTTNVLALDSLRAIGEGALEALLSEAHELAAAAGRELAPVAQAALAVMDRCAKTVAEGARGDKARLEAQARGIALSLGRSHALLLLCRHAEWARATEGDERPTFAAQRFLARGIDLVRPADPHAAALANDAS